MLVLVFIFMSIDVATHVSWYMCGSQKTTLVVSSNLLPCFRQGLFCYSLIGTPGLLVCELLENLLYLGFILPYEYLDDRCAALCLALHGFCGSEHRFSHRLSKCLTHFSITLDP